MKLHSFRGVSPAKAAAVLAVVAGAAFASVLPSNADVSAQSPSQSAVQVQSPAVREARGAALRVEVTFTCPASNIGSNYAYLNLKVTQRVGPAIANGDAYTQQICTGQPQTVTLAVHAFQHPFRVGTAFATAELSGPFPNRIIDSREIEVVR